MFFRSAADFLVKWLQLTSQAGVLPPPLAFASSLRGPLLTPRLTRQKTGAQYGVRARTEARAADIDHWASAAGKERIWGLGDLWALELL